MIKKIKLRTLLIGGIITLFFALLIGRVFYLQVLNNDFWQEQALALWDRKKPIPASRGTIMDRDGDILAMDAPAYTVVVNPRLIQANGLAEDVVKGLHKVLGKPENELAELVSAKGKDGKYLVNREVRNEGLKIDEEKKDQVEKLRSELESKLRTQKKVADSGINLIPQKKRFYPRKELAAHILGFTDRQGTAKDGFELRFDEQLEGTDGFAQYKSDKKGVKVPSADELYQPAKNGKNFMLTIDDTIQYYIEDAMREAYEQYKPHSMTVIAADPKTMQILGMANMPTFDPNKYWEAEYANYYNHAVRSVYEPGSTFKVVTLASAIQENLFDPNDTFRSGSIRAGGRTHYDIRRDGWGTISYLEGVKRSSNVAFIKLGYEMLGKERLKNYITQFGFKEKTGIDLPGEVLGRLNMERDSDISTVPYGYAVSVTPIQQIAAISAVANGGKLMKPQIVKEIHDPNNGHVEKIQPEVVRQIISPEAARKTGTYLEQVVADREKGTGWRAYIDGYRVAGKTGTAVKGDYSDKDKRVVSFVGYAPVEDPKIAVLVIIDEPKEDVGGGAGAAPVFQKIVSQTLKYWNVPKTGDTLKEAETKAEAVAAGLRKTPDLTGMKLEDVKTKLLAEGFAYEILGKGKILKKQYPPPQTPIAADQRVYLLTEDEKNMKIPDLRGESLRDAMEILTLMKVKVMVNGEGYVAEQKETTEKGVKVIYLTLKPAVELDKGGDPPQEDDEGKGEAASQTGDKTADKASGGRE